MPIAFLVQIDKLVQLFESPILTHVRLQLLEPEAHPFLLKALWGILMLLPQSPAYHTLKNRLSAVPELGLLRLQLNAQAQIASSGRASKPVADTPAAAGVDYKALLKTYEDVQAKHRRLQLQQKKAEAKRMERK